MPEARAEMTNSASTWSKGSAPWLAERASRIAEDMGLPILSFQQVLGVALLPVVAKGAIITAEQWEDFHRRLRDEVWNA